tara:strand:+ start:173 stop:598 length:426 start_codon:yes stop_codon:yes gene_type:complete
MPRKSTKKAKPAEQNTNTTTTTTETTEDITTPPTRTTSDEVNETGETVRDEIIDIDWETIRPVYEMKNQVKQMEQYFANMCLEFEKSKANLISQITYAQNDLYIMAQTIQKSKNIDESLTYELKLPANPEEKGYFLRKDSQ